MRAARNLRVGPMQSDRHRRPSTHVAARCASVARSKSPDRQSRGSGVRSCIVHSPKPRSQSTSGLDQGSQGISECVDQGSGLVSCIPRVRGSGVRSCIVHSPCGSAWIRGQVLYRAFPAWISGSGVRSCSGSGVRSCIMHSPKPRSQSTSCFRSMTFWRCFTFSGDLHDACTPGS